MNNKIWYLLGLVAVLFVIWYLFQPKTNTPEAGDGSQVEDGDPMAGWRQYSNGQLQFSVKHPEEVRVYTDAPDQIGLRLLGETQSEGTEMSDGIALNFRKVTKAANDSLANIAQSNLDQIEGVGTVKQAPMSAELGGKVGISYRYAALGDFMVYLLPISDTQVLEVSYMVSDPQGKGYEDVLDGMLGSLKVG